jgi:hypothetical protein
MPKMSTADKPTIFKRFKSMFALSQQAANEIFGWANVVLILGAALVLLGTIAAIWTGGIRERFADERISKSEADTATANAQAESAKAEAARANESAAQANLALEKFKAPRSLTPAQAENLRSSLMPYAGISVDILKYGETLEITNLANQIEAALSGAGLHPRNWTVTGGGAAVGILLITENGSSPKVEAAASSLLSAFVASEITCQRVSIPEAWKDWTTLPGVLMGPPWDKDKLAPIRMVIGSKP